MKFSTGTFVVGDAFDLSRALSDTCFLVAFRLYPRDIHWPLLAALKCMKAGGKLIKDLLRGCLPLPHLDVSPMVPPSPTFEKDVTFPSPLIYVTLLPCQQAMKTSVLSQAGAWQWEHLPSKLM